MELSKKLYVGTKAPTFSILDYNDNTLPSHIILDNKNITLLYFGQAGVCLAGRTAPI
ncbi:MAG: hypothetical protein HC854_15460 [Flavobacterium sp.]|nr:hypothetical protein [Flavobacterium sp.]